MIDSLLETEVPMFALGMIWMTIRNSERKVCKGIAIPLYGLKCQQKVIQLSMI